MSKVNVPNRTIFCHDNLGVLEKINTSCVDLIYLDPPFNKNRKFVAPTGSSAEGAEFSDIFREADVKHEWLLTIRQDDPDLFGFLDSTKAIGSNNYTYCYLCYMAVRLFECKRILKPTGSLFLHCDPTMSHYLKVMMDCIFDETMEQFRNEIIWERIKSAKGSQHIPVSFGRNTDTILYYAKSKKSILNPFMKLSTSESALKFDKVDDTGNRYFDDSSHIFRPQGLGNRPNLCYEWRGFKNPNPSGWVMTKERLEEEYQKGNFVIENKKLKRRKYERDYLGQPMGNLWNDIKPALGKEKIGYPTQKPLALLERIIESTTHKGSIVLDPFCGCATTCVASEKLGRKWIGIDISHKAYELVQQRFETELGLFGQKFNYKTSPPKRTDEGAKDRKQKYVYIISNPRFKDEYKVGVANDMKKRLGSYQTSDPDRAYKIEFSILTPYFNEIEKRIHSDFDNHHEWVKGDLQKIKKAIESLHKKGNKGSLI